MHAFLVHDQGDSVGVAIRDIARSESVDGLVLDGQAYPAITVISEIPLGHKVALRAIAVGEAVSEYGQPIGEAIAAIEPGALVHVHNLRSIRWALSVAGNADGNRGPHQPQGFAKAEAR